MKKFREIGTNLIGRTITGLVIDASDELLMVFDNDEYIRVVSENDYFIEEPLNFDYEPKLELGIKAGVLTELEKDDILRRKNNARIQQIQERQELKELKRLTAKYSGT